MIPISGLQPSLLFVLLSNSFFCSLSLLNRKRLSPSSVVVLSSNNTRIKRLPPTRSLPPHRNPPPASFKLNRIKPKPLLRDKAPWQPTRRSLLVHATQVSHLARCHVRPYTTTHIKFSLPLH